MRRKNTLPIKLSKNIFWIVFSITIGLFLVHSESITHLLVGAEKNKLIGSFVTGIFFTSIFTIAPAGIALATIAQNTSIATVALLGGLGATLGDFLIFVFIKDTFTNDMQEYASRSTSKRIQKLLSYKHIKFFRPLIGAIAFVSPLPDEIGLALLGLSNVPTIFIVLITFVLNIISVYFLCIASGILF